MSAPLTTEATPPVERAESLLRPELAAKAHHHPSGYIDLLGDDAPATTGIAQSLMLTDLVPRIYERWWRPFGARLAMGAFGPGMAGERREALELLQLEAGESVLDVACGPGNFSRGFGGAVGSDGLVVGLDASPTMLERAVADTVDDAVAYIRADALRLPFRDETFDAVCCFAALYLFSDPYAAMEEMARVLRGGGRIAVLTGARTEWAPARTAESVVSALSGLRLFERDEITGWLEGRGFDEVEREIRGIAQFVGATRTG